MDYLLDDETLLEQQCMTLYQRISHFNRRFPNVKLSVSKLSMIYRKNKIKKKKIKFTKIANRKQRKRISIHQRDTKQRVQDCIDRGFRIIYIDEFIVGKNTIQTHDYSKEHVNLCLDYQKVYTKPLACILAVSQERGIEKISIYDNSVKIPKL